jgi:hypothetical protein
MPILELRSGHQGLKPSYLVRAAAVIGRRRRHCSALNMCHTCMRWEISARGTWDPGPRVGPTSLCRSVHVVAAGLTSHLTATLSDFGADEDHVWFEDWWMVAS